MSIRCLMNGLEVNYPCSPVCALFGDCVTAFESQKKAKPMTNGDRIRMMSDDEFIELFGYNHFCNKIPTHNCKAGDMTCCECALEWLKQPVEVEG